MPSSSRPLSPARSTLPPLQVRYSNPDGTTGIVQTAGSVIHVTSVLPAAGAGHAARPQTPGRSRHARPPTWPSPALGGLIAVLVLLIVLALSCDASCSSYRATSRPAASPRHYGAGGRGARRPRCAGAEFSASGDLVAYYTALGNAVRRYLTERYDFPAFALTTRELEAEMMHRGLDRWQVRVAGGLLEQCDAVVYARYRPAAERADADLTAAYEVVEMSAGLEEAR